MTIELREAPAAVHHQPRDLPGQLVRLPVEGDELVWIVDHEPRLPRGYVEVGGSEPAGR